MTRLDHRSGSRHIAEYYRHEGDYDEGIITQKDVPPQERRKFSWLEIACILGIAVPVIIMLANLAVPIIGGAV